MHSSWVGILKSIPDTYEAGNDAMISSLYQYGLFVQNEKEYGGIVYGLWYMAEAAQSNMKKSSYYVEKYDRIVLVIEGEVIKSRIALG